LAPLFSLLLVLLLSVDLADGLLAVVAAFFLFAARADVGARSEKSAEAARKSRRFNRLSGECKSLVAEANEQAARIGG
jgi:hypothetical protein